MAQKNNTLLYGALAVGAYLLLSQKSTPAQMPQCGPGYYYDPSINMCRRIQTTTQNQNTGGGSSGGGGFWNSQFWNGLPNLIDSVSNVFNNTTPVNPGVGRYYY